MHNYSTKTQFNSKYVLVFNVNSKLWYSNYLAIKKNEIIASVATWMDLEIIILSEVSQTKTNNIWYRLYAESKK